MASSHIRSIGVALESSFGELSATTGLPDITALAYTALECDRASLDVSGSTPPMNEREQARSSPYGLPPEPATVWSGGSRVRRRTGTLAITCDLRTLGAASAYAGYADMPLHMLLASAMASFKPLASSDLVAGQVLTANNTRHTPTVQANCTIGAGFGVDLAGRKEWSFFTGQPGTDVAYSPGLSIDLSNETIRLTQTLYGALGVTAIGASCSLRLDGDGWQAFAFGCRMQSVALQFSERRAQLVITMQIPYLTDNHAGASLQDPLRADGAVAHALASYVSISEAIGTTVPAELSRTNEDADEVTLTFTPTLAPQGHSNSVLGMADLEVVDYMTEAEVTLSNPDVALDDDFFDQGERSVLIGLGPIGTGNGAAFILPSAHLKADPSARDLGGDLVRQKLGYRAGRFALDDGSGDAANSNFRIALPL